VLGPDVSVYNDAALTSPIDQFTHICDCINSVDYTVIVGNVLGVGVPTTCSGVTPTPTQTPTNTPTITETPTQTPTQTPTPTTFIPPGAIPIPIILEYQTLSPVEDIVVSNTLEDVCIFANNLETDNVNTNSYVLDSTTYYFDEETSMLYNSVTNTFAEDGYYISVAILYVTNGLSQVFNLQEFLGLCPNITPTPTKTPTPTPTNTSTQV
jgi:hypothetical protein